MQIIDSTNRELIVQYPVQLEQKTEQDGFDEYNSRKETTIRRTTQTQGTTKAVCFELHINQLEKIWVELMKRTLRVSSDMF